MITSKVKAAIAGGALLAAFAAGWTINERANAALIAGIKAAHAQEKAEAAEAATKALNEAIDRSNAAMKLAEEATDEARKNEEALRAAAAVSKRDRRLLDAARDSLAKLSTCSPSAALGSQAGGVPSGSDDADRLLQLLGSLESATGVFAEEAQRARDKGLLAERLYEVNRQACQ